MECQIIMSPGLKVNNNLTSVELLNPTSTSSISYLITCFRYKVSKQGQNDIDTAETNLWLSVCDSVQEVFLQAALL